MSSLTAIEPKITKDNNIRLILGIGYNSQVKHPAFANGEIAKPYSIWRAMLQRCYCAKTQLKQPTYQGCTVDERWHDYQDFAEWFESNEYSGLGYDLDKDLLVHGNKIYSPDTCVFVPRELNSLLTSCKAARGNLPQGVSFLKARKKFMARVRADGKERYLGLFDCPNEAHRAYTTAKEDYVRASALEWQGRIADDVFQALVNWRFVE